MPKQQAQFLIVVVGILLAVVAASVVLLMAVPQPAGPTSPPDAPTGEGVEENPLNAGISLEILQSTGYRLLDKTSIQQGALPVQPPAVTGKANPFL